MSNSEDGSQKKLVLSGFTNDMAGEFTVTLSFYYEQFKDVADGGTQQINITFTIKADPCAVVPVDPNFPTTFTKLVYTPTYKVEQTVIE